MTADVHTLAGAYALDALPDDERAFFERHLEVCDACRQEVAELRATAATLGTAAAETPPASLRDRVLAEAQVTRQLPPPDTAAETSRRRWPDLLRVAAAVALVALIGLGAWSAQLANRLADAEAELALLREERQAAETLIAVLHAPEAQVANLDAPDGTTARLVFAEGSDQAVLVADGLAQVAEDEAYQVWLLRDGVPEPDRVFRPDGDGETVVELAGQVRDADLVAITVEPRAGSARPTSDILIQGATGA